MLTDPRDAVRSRTGTEAVEISSRKERIFLLTLLSGGFTDCLLSVQMAG